MTTPTIRISPRFLQRTATGTVLVAAAMLLACSGEAAPASADDDALAQPRDAGTHSWRDADTAAMPEVDAGAAPVTDGSAEPAMEVFAAGAGDATVVFEAGFGDDWTPWRQVATAVASEARVFAYSRPGYGQSEPSHDPRDAGHIVKDLRALLTARGFAPPYVLVGHSFGGTYMELFAKAHPDEVAGLVLVDPRHRDFASACEQAGLAGCGIPGDVVATLWPHLWRGTLWSPRLPAVPVPRRTACPPVRLVGLPATPA